MKKSKRQLFCFGFIIAFALCMMATFVLPTFGKATAYASSEVQTVLVGDKIEAKSFSISHEGSSIPAEGMTIVYPSGGVYSGDELEISQAGLYQITYHATVGDKRIEQTQKYKAIRRPQDLIVGDEGMETSFGKYFVPHETLTPQKNIKGAIVTFRSGQSITFTTTIATKNLTEDFSILDLIVMPSVFGETDFERLTVRITDGKDKNNFVEIIIDSSNTIDGDGQISYVKASASGQKPGGYEGSTYHTTVYGTAIEHSFRALARKNENRKNITLSEHSLTLAIDNNERKVFCGPKSYDSDERLLVNDLDDPTHFKANPWGGFTSDEVSVTITSGKFVKVEGKVLIKQFGEFDLSKNIDDTEKPEVRVDYDFSKPVPVAVVGRDFPLFAFSAKDNLDNNLKHNVFVYYLDGNGNKITVPTDGKTFKVNYAGKYLVSYCAEDYSGNLASQTVEIEAKEAAPHVFIAIEEPLITCDVYQTVKIPMVSEMKVFGGSGELKVERFVYNPLKERVSVKDRLTLDMLGDYKVVYEVTDYLGCVTHGVITIRSQGTKAPIFVQEPEFESLLIKGFNYEIPKPLVVEAVDGELKEIECEIYVNGILVDDSFVADGEEVNIRYAAKGQTGEVEREITLTVVDTEYGKYKSKYFYSEDGITVSDELTHIELKFSNDGRVEFVNALNSNNLLLALSYEAEKINFSSMNLIFTDRENAEVKVTVEFSFDKERDAWYMSLKGKEGKIPFATSDGTFSLSYSSSTKQVVDASGVSAGEISLCDNGDEFLGFSDKVYLAVEFKSVVGESAVKVAQICNQSMGYNKASIEDAYDEIEPVIVLNEVFVNRQKLGAKAKIPTAKAFDVLSQISVFTVTVRLQNEVVASGDASEPLDLLLNKAGNYIVVYYAEDVVGNYKQIQYVIIVNDETTPTLTVKGKIKKEYKVGSKISIPKYSATDNGENCYIQVELILPNNELRLLHYVENGKLTSLLSRDNKLYESAFKASDSAFYANMKGVYILRILAYDEYYNYTVQEFVFTVK